MEEAGVDLWGGCDHIYIYAYIDTQNYCYTHTYRYYKGDPDIGLSLPENLDVCRCSEP